MTRFIALLRGINVGGNNMIKMADLKAAFERRGFANVSTYINSGNVLFNSLLDEAAASAAILSVAAVILSAAAVILSAAAVILSAAKDLSSTLPHRLASCII